jgi:hypothetical protein
MSQEKREMGVASMEVASVPLLMLLLVPPQGGLRVPLVLLQVGGTAQDPVATKGWLVPRAGIEALRAAARVWVAAGADTPAAAPGRCACAAGVAACAKESPPERGQGTAAACCYVAA